jgi:tetratricopeptide (TPR) repeat protein
LSYRILAMGADQLPAGSQKDAANASAVEALAQLVRDFPNLRDAIFRQLAARLPASPDLTKLDPVLLLALVDQGRQAIVGAGPLHPADGARLREATGAAREILERLSNKNFPRAEAVEASFLLGIFQEYLGDKIGAVDSLLNHIERFGGDPGSHARVALERARSLIAQLRQSNPSDPTVEQLENRFLPIAINQPFNRHEFALQYAASLFAQSKWEEAIKYYRMVPDTEQPGRLLIARYGEMIALKKELEETPNLQADQKQQWTQQIQNLADSVTSLASEVIDGSGSAEEKERAKSTLARMTLIAADISRRERNDPQRVLQLLEGFENAVTGLQDAKSLVNGALFLRVQAYMQLGRDNDATATLVKYLNTATPNEGAQTVHDLLATLNTELDQARRSGSADQMRQLADNRAMLSGFLVKWAEGSSDPKVHGYSYIYRRFDADTKRLAAELETDPTARQRDLAGALQLYQQLLSPENVAMYQAGLDPGADKDYPDPLVTLGIGLIAYEQGDCQTVKSTLGRLIQDEKLGEDNDQYWEAAYKLLDCMHTLANQGDKSTTLADVQKSLKVLYLIWRDETGGGKYHDKFEAMRKEILPDWTPPASAK